MFSKCLNLLIDSIFSVSCIFCLPLSTFLFGEESVEVDGFIGDLLSFDFVLEEDFAVEHFIGHVITVFSP